MKRIVITGAQGLLGWHTHARLYAQNCMARFQKKPQPFDLVPLGRHEFGDDTALKTALTGADAVFHFAGVNRGSDDEVGAGNPAIATRLAQACAAIGTHAHIVYANSIHADRDTLYGNSKRIAGDILKACTPHFTNLILPHIFGEGARPFYNNITATLIHQLIKGEDASVNPDGQLNLLYAGVAAQTAIEAVQNAKEGDVVPKGRPISVPDLFAKLQDFHSLYTDGIYPDLSDDFDLALFNSYRAAGYPHGWPRPIALHSDPRGMLFEAAKAQGGGQVFCSTTNPGVTRGDHFHLHKVERFLVISGQATIRIRKVLSDTVWEYPVSGDRPTPVDIPTLHTHSIENTGSDPLVTLFWTHEIFDPENPDTYADKVLPCAD